MSEAESDEGEASYDDEIEMEPSGEKEEEEEEPEETPDNPLSSEIIAENISLLCKTGDGLAHAFVRLDVHECEITSIENLETFIHLRFVDISKNQISDISPLNSLTHLLTLHAQYNLLTSAKLNPMPFLQVANFSNNQIRTTEGISHPLLERLCLNYNLIEKVTGLDPTVLTKLHVLELRGNKLETMEGLYLPKLKSLFLAANAITSLKEIDRMEFLTMLHLRDNQLSELDGFSGNFKSLHYINLRGNKISSLKEMEKLECIPFLKALILSENPIAEEDDYRSEVLISLRKLDRLDKEEFTEEEKAEAEETYEQRKSDEMDVLDDNLAKESDQKVA